jgi:septum formation protein
MTALGDVDLVLASTSRYRRELLTRLTPHFRCMAPHTDETPRAAETPAALAARLAEAKARAVAAHSPGALVIGSDQVAALGSRIFGKPGSADNAVAQLRACAANEVVFHTAICLIDARAGTQPAWHALDTTRVRMRALTDAQITRYIAREPALDCAGSFKSEGLGIALFEAIESTDPTALVGLPLIALCGLLREAGIEVV